MDRFIRVFLLLTLVIFISGCVKRPVRLPSVVEGWKRKSAAKNAYIVQKNDTLYSIAWAFDLDYRDLAAINNIASPYTLRGGERLRIAYSSAKKAKQAKTKIKYKKQKRTVAKVLTGWCWPTKGKVIANFTNKLGGNHGINIKGIYGQSVKASNDGEVVYSGTGIRSYGKLIIIKHNDDYLSAYAYNQHMLVKEGDHVKAGQKIATMGHDRDARASLHFEIRRFGKPVNPLHYLPKKS